jgi:hypothetical protein
MSLAMDHDDDAPSPESPLGTQMPSESFTTTLLQTCDKSGQSQSAQMAEGHWVERTTEHTENVWVHSATVVPHVVRRQATVLGVVAGPLETYTPAISGKVPLESQQPTRLLPKDSVISTLTQFHAPQTAVTKGLGASSANTGHWEQRRLIRTEMVWVATSGGA